MFQIDFGVVAVNVARQKIVNITNMNPVPISVYLNRVSVSGALVSVRDGTANQKHRRHKLYVRM